MSMDENDKKPKRAFGRSLKDFEPLSESEKKLIDCAARGAVCELGKIVPEAPTPENLVRPELIRFLALGGDDDAPVHEKGVRLRGAWISADPDDDPFGLDLEGCRLTTGLWLFNCYFANDLIFRDAHVINLSLNGSVFPGFSADRMKLDGGLFLRLVQSKGTVKLSGAEIGGDLDCSGGGFAGIPSQGKELFALVCNGATIGGNLLLQENEDQTKAAWRRFHAIGEVRLTGITIGGNLSCEGGFFYNQSHRALTCDGMNIDGGLFFRKSASANGIISLAHARVGTLADDLICWPDQSLDLDGFSYERIAASSSLDAKRRIAWLDKQRPKLLNGENFALQPWVHLAKVLREQGHFREAAEVDIAREKRLRAAGKIGDRLALLSWARKWGQLDGEGRYASFLPSLNEQITYLLHWFYGWFSDYGHRPIKIVYFAFLIWFVLASVYAIEANDGHFAPAIAMTDKSLGNKCVIEQGNESVNWTRCNELLRNYPRFNAWAYSLDLILPVVQLGEFARWNHVWRGDWLSFSGLVQVLIYFEKIFGWVAALTLAAITAGLVKRRDS